MKQIDTRKRAMRDLTNEFELFSKVCHKLPVKYRNISSFRSFIQDAFYEKLDREADNP
mgnify:CR=1 FL=1